MYVKPVGFFSDKKLVLEDIKLHQEIHGANFNVSEWKIINSSYFGHECDQLMVSPISWYSKVCLTSPGTCVNNVLSKWTPQNSGIQLIPAYNYLTNVCDSFFKQKKNPQPTFFFSPLFFIFFKIFVQN